MCKDFVCIYSRNGSCLFEVPGTGVSGSECPTEKVMCDAADCFHCVRIYPDGDMCRKDESNEQS